MAAEAGLFPGAIIEGEVIGFLLCAVSRSAQQPGETFVPKKADSEKSHLIFEAAREVCMFYLESNTLNLAGILQQFL